MGSYPIQQGTLKLSSNYNLTYLGANLTITKTNAASIIASSVSSSVYGQVVYVNVQIYSPSGVGTPTGTVVLVDGDGNHVLGQATLSGLIASFHVSTLGLGGHALRGVYLGDGSFNSVITGAAMVTVNPAFTTTSIVSQRSGSGFELIASVAVNYPGGGTPTGTVTFMTGNRKMGTVAVVNGLSKLFVTSKLALNKWFSGSFLSGNGNYKASSRLGLREEITRRCRRPRVAASPGARKVGRVDRLTTGPRPPKRSTRTKAGQPGEGSRCRGL